jgi:enoyl-CoA hydratase/carnithine racemase
MSDIKFPKSYPEGASDNAICRVEEEGELYILHLVNDDNRFSPTSMSQIQNALENIQTHYWQERDTEQKPRALVTTGQNQIFSNGLNLESIADIGLESFLHMYIKLIVTMLKFPIPTVAAINGHAFAGGMVSFLNLLI